jgi:hypothetical protein
LLKPPVQVWQPGEQALNRKVKKVIKNMQKEFYIITSAVNLIAIHEIVVNSIT